jgi:hypothetical protein
MTSKNLILIQHNNYNCLLSLLWLEIWSQLESYWFVDMVFEQLDCCVEW